MKRDWKKAPRQTASEYRRGFSLKHQETWNEEYCKRQALWERIVPVLEAAEAALASGQLLYRRECVCDDCEVHRNLDAALTTLHSDEPEEGRPPL